MWRRRSSTRALCCVRRDMNRSSSDRVLRAPRSSSGRSSATVENSRECLPFADPRFPVRSGGRSDGRWRRDLKPRSGRRLRGRHCPPVRGSVRPVSRVCCRTRIRWCRSGRCWLPVSDRDCPRSSGDSARLTVLDRGSRRSSLPIPGARAIGLTPPGCRRSRPHRQCRDLCGAGPRRGSRDWDPPRRLDPACRSARCLRSHRLPGWSRPSSADAVRSLGRDPQPRRCGRARRRSEHGLDRPLSPPPARWPKERLGPRRKPRCERRDPVRAVHRLGGARAARRFDRPARGLDRQRAPACRLTADLGPRRWPSRDRGYPVRVVPYREDVPAPRRSGQVKRRPARDRDQQHPPASARSRMVGPDPCRRPSRDGRHPGRAAPCLGHVPAPPRSEPVPRQPACDPVRRLWPRSAGWLPVLRGWDRWPPCRGCRHPVRALPGPG